MQQMITASDLASKIGVHAATVRKHAARLGIQRVGAAYVFTVSDARRILYAIDSAETGNPLMRTKAGQRKLRKNRNA